MSTNLHDIELSIIIPIYNEEKSITATIDEIKKTLTNAGIRGEIIAVNDGSTDGSLQLLKRIEGITVVSHSQNKGYGASLKTGIRMARAPAVCITDADGTYPNHMIPALFTTYRNNNLDMVVGSRTGKNVSYPFIKKIPKFFLIKLSNYIANADIPDINSGLRIFSRDVALLFFNLYPDGFSFTTTITMALMCRGYDVEYVPIDYYERTGESKIAPIKDTAGFFNLLCKIAVFFNPMKFFLPFVAVLALISSIFLIRDVFFLQNLSQSAVLFPILTVMIFLMGLIADMISKK